MHQQSLDRRQPSVRSRPQLREIPLQRQLMAAGNGESSPQWTARYDRSSRVASCVTAPREAPARARDERRIADGIRGGGVPVGVGAPDAATGPDIQARIAVTAGPDVLEERGAQLVDERLTDAVVAGGVEPAPTPAALPIDGLGEPVEAPGLFGKSQELKPVARRRPEVLGGDVRQAVRRGGEQGRSLAGPAALSAGTATGDAESVNQPKGDVTGDQLRDAPPGGGRPAEEGQPAVGVLAAGDRLPGDLPVVSDQSWEWMEPLLPASTGR